ncbi:restriction endonuclease subunit S [Enterococcus faecium]|uniref:restriction endonuclease subunit S n=1 Tax=Enterococcus faecium TaxID=1352 RepID=UPI0035C9C2A7
MSNDTQPEIRFPGFTDDWELRKSKELCTISTGKGNTQDKVDDGAYPFYVRSATIEKSDEYLYDQEAVLTVGDGVGTGKVYHYVNGKYNLHQRVYRMYDFKDVSAKYFYYYFSNNFYKRVMSMTAKTSVDSVRMEMIADMNIVFPSVKEQENIVELFSNLDNTIALHQRKLDLLKETKKGFLQKMFPKNGAKVPEIRFPGFTEDWEERKLGQVANYRRGSFPQPYGNKEWYDGENSMPFVQVVDVGDNLRLVEDTKQKISELAQPKSVFVEEGKVVVTLQGSIGRVAITQYPAYVDRTLLIFESYKAEMDEYYFAYVIQQLFEYEKTRAPGGTIKTITKEALSNFTISFPSIAEQKKLGKFFEQLDDTIALHQRKLDLLKETKKGFLQKMFV